jgi:hypothetical protein
MLIPLFSQTAVPQEETSRASTVSLGYSCKASLSRMGSIPTLSACLCGNF